MAKYTTFIKSEDAKAQAEFYMQALGGEIQSMMTHGQLPDASEELKDKVLHLCVLAGGVNFFMSDSVFEPLVKGNNVHLALDFETEAEARQAFENLAAGGHIAHPFEPAFWGSLFGEIEDKFGIKWMITAAPEVRQG
ncbi:VOC family protein [Paenibacillus sp. PL91]|uniref:VOC family protein n=1 Tax=Paenibacillus sp. PL91 TaxID=2729538 RepID=UPI00145CE147|nr:VOC family protein [Paenibacillus sp. PL91]MBC9203814.1 VOC family protein [Paenibacillus sp. PL91]